MRSVSFALILLPALLQAQSQQAPATQAHLDSLTAQVKAKDARLQEAYARLLAKCAFAPGDDQWQQWGKIQRLLTNLRNTVRIRGSSDREGKPMLERMVADIDSRLFEFSKRNKDSDPAAPAYARSAMGFAALLAGGKVADAGILVIGTEHRVPHPVLRVGDIVLKQNGHPVRFVADFSARKNDPGADVVQVLRIDGRGEVVTLTVPSGSPRVVFLELRDTDERPGNGRGDPR